MFVVLKMEPQINGDLLQMSLYNIRNYQTPFKIEYILNISLNREFYKLSIDIYTAMIRKVFLSEF